MGTIILISLSVGIAIGAGLLSLYNKQYKTYYLNLYKSENNLIYSSKFLCETKREADFDSAGRKDYVMTVKIKI